MWIAKQKMMWITKQKMESHYNSLHQIKQTIHEMEYDSNSMRFHDNPSKQTLPKRFVISN